MALPKMGFNPVDGLRNIVSYIAKPPTGQAREQVQGRLDEIRDYINDDLTVGVDNHISDLTAHGMDKQSILRQTIINGGFNVNQRAKSGTVVLTTGQYGHDRWKAGASGCTYTFATVNNVTTITITAGSLQQVIEGLNLYSGAYTLSWSGMAQGKIDSGSLGISPRTGAITGGTNCTVEFGTGTISNVKMNFGSVALPFMAKSFDDELRACMRYYEKSYSYGNAPGTVTNQGQVSGWIGSNVLNNGYSYNCFRYKAPKRVVPTIMLYSIGGTTPRIDIGGTACVATPLDIGTEGVGTIQNISGSTWNSATAYNYHYVAEAEL